jgi:serine/threonine-protein kinase
MAADPDTKELPATAAHGRDGGGVDAGKRIGKYLLVRKIGSGGMGAVYLAEDASLGRRVALKILPRDKARNPTLVKRFQAEARAAANLAHDNIVAVYDAGEADGYLFIALEYVQGEDAFALVSKRGPLPLKWSVELIRQVASALDHAASRNIVHRDIKPSNLLIRSDGTVKLTDLGLARSLEATADAGITRAGHTVGTVDYMPPEQARDSKLADVRSDIYSLGCTWYFLLTGQVPYPDGDLTNKLLAHATRPLPNPQDVNSRVSEGVVAVLQRMTAKDPSSRYQTAAELVDDLDSSTLTAEGVSGKVWAALDDDDVTPAAPAKGAPPFHPPRQSKTGKRGRSHLPPRIGEESDAGEDGEEPGDFRVEIDFVRLTLVIAAVAAAVIGVLWLVRNL